MICLIDGETKKCSACQTFKSLESFHKDKTSKMGYAYNCKECANAKSRKWHSNRDNLDRRNKKVMQRIRQRKQDLVQLFGNKCQDCGQSFPQCCYDFHHLDPTEKDHNISHMLTLSPERLLIEKEKCVMLCSNCHRIRHHDMSSGW